ncbi:DUF5050 domain-containing protein [Cohnella mopanensis]|uniref:DUF5050 domain-containing protein n=1 Tax=Cohnella mopanensis TaxID=2911966 RepID=UPI001EF789E8|nr:DUF5050 domain-containing protein [Cohnella mopanensis]
MNSMSLAMKRTFLSLLLFTLTLTGIGAGAVHAEETSSSSEEVAVIYYVSNGDLYRVKTDGSPSQRLRKNFDGVELKPAGDYMYYMFSENSTTLLRLSLTDEQAKARDYGGDKRIVHLETYGDQVYFMDDKGGLYRAASTVEKADQASLIADMADVNFPSFTVVEGRVYYNALRNGRTTWVASKAADGSGAVQWVAAGALESSYYARTDSTSLNLIINTKPEETQYSTDCMVLYTLPKKGGAAKAVNTKAPLDANSVYSGLWAGNDAIMYNKGIRLSGNGDYDYTKGKGQLLTKAGKTIDLSKSGIIEIANAGTNKFAYVGANGKAYVATLANNKVTSTKTLSLSNVGYVRNMMNKGKVRSTVFFGQNGAYVLNADLTLKKMVGVEWDLCVYEDDIDGIFYVNAGDNGRLYRMTVDGKATTKLTDEKVSRIVLITKA